MSSLNEKALLVNLTVGMWDGYAYSEQATREGFGSKDLGRANKALLKESAKFKATKAAFTSVRQYVNMHTVPWKDNGVRMLPSAQYLDFCSALRVVRDHAESVLAEFVAVYADEVEHDRQRFERESTRSGKPTLFSYGDYPASIADRFKITVGFEPVPSSGDFRVAISDEDKQALDDAVGQAEADVTAHLLNEIARPMMMLVEHLRRPVEEIKRFHDSIVTNVYDQIDRLRKLNINNDQRVCDVLDAVQEQLYGYAQQPAVLKESQAARDDAKQKTVSIMEMFGI